MSITCVFVDNICREREKYHKQLEDQAAEYKVIIQHHLSVNEKMLRDKEQLSEKCCNLAGILSVAESKVVSLKMKPRLLL
jgi:hypothetical protein